MRTTTSSRTFRSALLAAAAPLAIVAVAIAAAPNRLADEADRSAFRSWFTFLADAQFERPSAGVTDCASLVRHAYREALRPHTPEWFRTSRLPVPVAFPDVRQTPAVEGGALLLFRVSRNPDRFAEFADADTLIRLNAKLIGRDAHAAQPGDLLYFRQEGADSPAHLMIFVGDSRFDRERRDWLVYHTGPSTSLRSGPSTSLGSGPEGRSPGETRKVSLADLDRHPAPRWRPIAQNPAFIGLFRLTILDREG